MFFSDFVQNSRFLSKFLKLQVFLEFFSPNCQIPEFLRIPGILATLFMLFQQTEKITKTTCDNFTAVCQSCSPAFKKRLENTCDMNRSFVGFIHDKGMTVSHRTHQRAVLKHNYTILDCRLHSQALYCGIP